MPASPASTVSEWVQPSTTGMGTTVSSPIFTPQASTQVPKAPTPMVSAPLPPPATPLGTEVPPPPALTPTTTQGSGMRSESQEVVLVGT
eukprot:8724218-Alexandrium_andersonii.AAC.1